MQIPPIDGASAEREATLAASEPDAAEPDAAEPFELESPALPEAATEPADEATSEGPEAAVDVADEATPASRARAAARPHDPAGNLAELEAISTEIERLLATEGVKLRTYEKRLSSADNKYPKLLPLPSAGKRAATERFQEARRRLVIRIGELKEAEEWKRWANVPKQEMLIQIVEALVTLETTPHLGEQLRLAQAEWKLVGPAPQEKAQELWQRFKVACDALYDKVKAHRALQDVELEANLRLKEALCEQAEALSDSSDWQSTADALKRLQAEWKAIGQVPRKRSESVWKRFRTACDRFFERRRPLLEKNLGEMQANLERKQAIIAKLDALLESADPEEAARTATDLRQEWKRIGHVHHREVEPLSERAQQAADAVYARRDEARVARAAEQLAAVEGPLAEAEALLASQAAGQEFDSAELAQKTFQARAALRELAAIGNVKELGARFEAHLMAALAAVGPAFKGTDLDPEQSRKRKEKLLAKIEALAPKAEAAAPVTSTLDFAARFKAAQADRALGGVLSKQATSRSAAEVVTEARDAWARLGPVPGTDGAALEERFAQACRQATSKPR